MSLKARYEKWMANSGTTISIGRIDKNTRDKYGEPTMTITSSVPCVIENTKQLSGGETVDRTEIITFASVVTDDYIWFDESLAGTSTAARSAAERITQPTITDNITQEWTLTRIFLDNRPIPRTI